MNDSAFQSLWRSAANQPAADAARLLAASYPVRLRRRRRIHIVWLVWTFLALGLVTTLALTQAFRAGSGPVEPAVIALLAAPWAAAFYFLRSFLKGDRVASDSTLAWADLLPKAIASHAAERRRLKVIGGLLVVMLPVGLLSVMQLHAAGKAPGNQAWSLAVFISICLGGGLAFVVFRYLRHVVPEGRFLEARRSELRD